MFKKENFETLNSLKAIQKMKWQDFEWFCKYFLEALGFQRVQVTKRRYDGGIDHIAYLNGDKYLVQDKHWNKNGSKKKRYVPVAIVRELGGVMKQKDCDKGIIIATVPAYETTKIEAKKLGITIIDLEGIIQRMKKLKSNFDDTEYVRPKKPLQRIWFTRKELYKIFIVLFIMFFCFLFL